MKQLAIIFCVLGMLSMSCDQRDETRNTYTNDQYAEIKFERLTNRTVGYKKNGKMKLNISDKDIMNTFIQFSRKYNPDLKPLSFEIIKVDNNQFLRFYSEGNIMSTVALLLDENNEYKTGSTICETQAIDKEDGCLPDGLYCTKLKLDDISLEPAGECKRTTVSFDKV